MTVFAHSSCPSLTHGECSLGIPPLLDICLIGNEEVPRVRIVFFYAAHRNVDKRLALVSFSVIVRVGAPLMFVTRPFVACFLYMWQQLSIQRGARRAVVQRQKKLSPTQLLLSLSSSRGSSLCTLATHKPNMTRLELLLSSLSF